MAERTAEVVAVKGARVTLRAQGACSGCIGCGGRCELMRGYTPQDRIEIGAEEFPAAPAPGQRWILELDDRTLLQRAARGYGLAWLGLLLGAALGYACADPLGAPRDPSTALGALLGTLAGAAGSKRRPAAADGLRVARRGPI